MEDEADDGSNQEHVELVRQLVMAKIEKEETANELVRVKLQYVPRSELKSRTDVLQVCRARARSTRRHVCPQSFIHFAQLQ